MHLEAMGKLRMRSTSAGHDSKVRSPASPAGGPVKAHVGKLGGKWVTRHAVKFFFDAQPPCRGGLLLFGKLRVTRFHYFALSRRLAISSGRGASKEIS